MGHPGFGFIAIIAVAAYVYATVASGLATLGFVGLRRLAGNDTRTAATRVGGAIGVLTAAIAVFAFLTVGGESAAFVAVTMGLTALVTGVLPLGVGIGVLSLATDADDPLRYAVYGWTPGLLTPFAVVSLGSDPAGTLGIVGLLAIPTVATTAIGYAVHRLTR